MTEYTQPVTIGAAWFREEEYEEAKALFIDNNLPATFEQWNQVATQTRDYYLRQGITVIPVYIDPKTFPSWCRRNGMEIDTNARTQYAAMESDRITRHAHESGNSRH